MTLRAWALAEQFGGPAAARGTVALVGGGPGDPGLIGLRAAQLLATATFVAYDRLSPPEALELCAPDCERVYVGKLPDRHALEQSEINQLLVERAQAGDAVVRFKGGDPFVLGRGSEEALACVAAGVPFEVVPAVTSAVAAPAYAGVPVTHRNVAPAFAVVTGHEDPSKDELQVDWTALAAFPGTLALLMAVGRITEIAAALVAAGKPASTPVALVQWGTTPRQRSLVSTLGEVGAAIHAAGISSPAVTVVGEVAALHDELAWFERRPLAGVSVLVPRTRHQAGELSARLRAIGAEPVEAPTIAIEPTREPDRLRACLAEAGDGAYDWVAFTSVNGVDAVWDVLAEQGADTRLFARTRVAAVGPGTAEALAERGLRADLVPERATTRALADELIAAETRGPERSEAQRVPGPERSEAQRVPGQGRSEAQRVPGQGRSEAQRVPSNVRALLPRADIATPTLTQALGAAGWDVVEVEAYRTVNAPDLPPQVRHRLDRGEIDVLAFASSSTVRNFVALLGHAPEPRMRVASIGPVTTQTCAELGLRVDAEASPHDLDGLVQAVVVAAGRPV